MITRDFNPVYDLPERFSRFSSIALLDGLNWLDLIEIPSKDMINNHINHTVIGLPTYFSVCYGRMFVYPTPDREWEIARTYDVAEEPCRR